MAKFFFTLKSIVLCCLAGFSFKDGLDGDFRIEWFGGIWGQGCLVLKSKSTTAKGFDMSILDDFGRGGRLQLLSDDPLYFLFRETDFFYYLRSFISYRFALGVDYQGDI